MRCDCDDAVRALEDGEYGTALAKLRVLADAGDPKAPYILALMYVRGQGVAASDAEAVKWLRRAADAGLNSAREQLCAGIAQPAPGEKEADEFSRSSVPAAIHGDVEEQLATGFHHARGQGVPRDDEEAVKWFRSAADLGSNEAHAALGFMWADGRGVPQDDTRAVKWFRRAADQGLRAAQIALGFLCSVGRGIQQDYIQAYMWFSIAARQEGDDLDREIAAMEAKLSPENLDRAKKLAREWQPRSG